MDPLIGASGDNCLGEALASRGRLLCLERSVQAFLKSGSLSGLEIIGYGDCTVAFALRTDAGDFAVKRLPPFVGREQFERYRTTLARYLGALVSANIEVLNTSICDVGSHNGRFIAYIVQPLISPTYLLPNVLRNVDADSAQRLIAQLISLVGRAVSAQTGLDSDISNWCIDRTRLILLDNSLPLLRDETGSELVDLSPYIASVPLPVRHLLYFGGTAKLIDKFFDLRRAYIDLLCGFYREGLPHLGMPALAFVNASLNKKVEYSELRQTYLGNELLWYYLRKMQRIERFWLKLTGRHYSFVLPPARAFSQRLRTPPPRCSSGS